MNNVDLVTRRLAAQAIRDMWDRQHTDMPKHLNDWCFSVEAEYQREFFPDNPDEWGVVPEHYIEAGLEGAWEYAE